jgi:hypothetical protein
MGGQYRAKNYDHFQTKNGDQYQRIFHLNNEPLLTQQQSLKQDNELTPGSTIQQQEKIASDSSPADELWKELTANEREQTLATEFRRQQFKKRKRKRLHQ